MSSEIDGESPTVQIEANGDREPPTELCGKTDARPIPATDVEQVSEYRCGIGVEEEIRENAILE